MPTFDSNAFKTASTATPSATFSCSLHHQLSSPFSINNHSTSIPSFSSTSPLSSSLSLIPWNFKTWNPLATPLKVQAHSSLYTTSERMPFTSHSWTSASFLDVEAVAPNESDPFFEKRDLAQLQKLMVAITKQRQEFKKLGCPLKTVLRVFRDPMSDDDMVSGHNNDSDDEDEDGDCKSMGLVNDAANTKADVTTDADAASDTDHEKKDQVALSNVGGGAGAPKAENVGTATHSTTNLSKKRGAQSCNCYKVGQRIDKLAQGVSTLKLRCSHAHLHAHFKVNDATIAAMSRVPFPVLECRYQGPPPSPSSPSVTLSSLAEDKLVPSDSAASIAQAPTPQNNGVTVSGSLVVIKLPKTTRTVVMPKGHTSVSILLPPTTPTTAEEDPSQVDEEGVEVEEEGGAAGQKRSSVSLKSGQDDASLLTKKRR
ncbi:hypothetical protein EC957_001223 [Mortierella hygrophila]|uniref:Uncharacterized protein n=1 Tax=Mortierella hygrophila TaxID=979708 RepID=A0A9P6F6N3_9FUNG|nr:hypothetical protein EC957_001223 [Mortierella hygrophila]